MIDRLIRSRVHWFLFVGFALFAIACTSAPTATPRPTSTPVPTAPAPPPPPPPPPPPHDRRNQYTGTTTSHPGSSDCSCRRDW